MARFFYLPFILTISNIFKCYDLGFFSFCNSLQGSHPQKSLKTPPSQPTIFWILSSFSKNPPNAACPLNESASLVVMRLSAAQIPAPVLAVLRARNNWQKPRPSGAYSEYT